MISEEVVGKACSIISVGQHMCTHFVEGRPLFCDQKREQVQVYKTFGRSCTYPVGGVVRSYHGIKVVGTLGMRLTLGTSRTGWTYRLRGSRGSQGREP